MGCCSSSPSVVQPRAYQHVVACKIPGGKGRDEVEMEFPLPCFPRRGSKAHGGGCAEVKKEEDAMSSLSSTTSGRAAAPHRGVVLESTLPTLWNTATTSSSLGFCLMSSTADLVEGWYRVVDPGTGPFPEQLVFHLGGERRVDCAGEMCYTGLGVPHTDAVFVYEFLGVGELPSPPYDAIAKVHERPVAGGKVVLQAVLKDDHFLSEVCRMQTEVDLVLDTLRRIDRVRHPVGTSLSAILVDPWLAAHRLFRTLLGLPLCTPDYSQWRVVGAPLGRGSFGTVFLGQLPSAQQIAVKVVDLDEDGIEVVSPEYELMEQLSHPNIVRCMGHRISGTTLEIYMEYIPGGTVAQMVRKVGGGLRVGVVQAYVKQVLHGLAYLHSIPVVHRDIKGANLLLWNDTVKIADFGCSKLILPGRGAATLVGTPCYIAPEVLVPEAQYGVKCDIWSLGCTIIEMMGESPWEGAAGWQLFYSIATNPDAKPTVPAATPPKLAAFLHRCFLRPADHRPTAEDLLCDPFIASPLALLG
eukprot:Sspe_Gene.73471::Locus_44376_Transcript_1_1_Confidence_1.000_Length_2004::g.73471::m.73471